MKKFFEIALGIVTSIGGFLEVGAIATTAQAGAEFGLQLLWAVAVGTICLIFLVEMSGRLAAVSQHTLKDAMRERFGVDFLVATLAIDVWINWLVLASEIGGISLALQLVTGIGFQWWAVPVAFVTWLLLWKGTFSLIENGISVLGLVAIVFLVATIALHPPLRQLGSSLLPSLPGHDAARYWFIAVSILGAAISPYLFYFYSSGAIEDHWDERYIGVNRLVATLGMTFGGVLSGAVLVVSAMVLHPKGIQVERFEQAALMLTEPLGRWGFYLFAATLAITCLGAALEIALSTAYEFAQGFGWNWGESVPPKKAARFSLTYTGVIVLATLLMVFGIDPLKLTLFSMALTAASLPLITLPFLILMNDAEYMGEHRNGWISNTAVIVISTLASLLALVAIPLEIMGG